MLAKKAMHSGGTLNVADPANSKNATRMFLHSAVAKNRRSHPTGQLKNLEQGVTQNYGRPISDGMWKLRPPFEPHCAPPWPKKLPYTKPQGQPQRLPAFRAVGTIIHGSARPRSHAAEDAQRKTLAPSLGRPQPENLVHSIEARNFSDESIDTNLVNLVLLAE